MFFFQRIWHLKKQQSNVRMYHKTFGILENPLTSQRKFTYWNNNKTKMNWRCNIFNFLKLRKSKKNLYFSETLYLKQAFNLFMIYTFSYYIDYTLMVSTNQSKRKTFYYPWKFWWIGMNTSFDWHYNRDLLYLDSFFLVSDPDYWERLVVV